MTSQSLAWHAVFRPIGDTRALIEDISSGNVTEVNGRRINAPTQLNAGDRVVLGGIALQVELVATPVAATAVNPEDSSSQTRPVATPPPRPEFGVPAPPAQVVPLPAWQQTATSQSAQSGKDTVLPC